MKRALIALAGLALAPIVLATLVVTLATVSGDARLVRRMWGMP